MTPDTLNLMKIGLEILFQLWFQFPPNDEGGNKSLDHWEVMHCRHPCPYVFILCPTGLSKHLQASSYQLLLLLIVSAFVKNHKIHQLMFGFH